MGLIRKKSSKKEAPDGRAPFSSEDSPPPTLARRSANRHSTIKAGRTIGEQREKLETANERELARQKDKRARTCAPERQTQKSSTCLFC